MTEPFLGEIRLFGGNYAPQNWALCDGQLLAITNFEELYSLLGTQYGGDGRTTFALPDLRGRVAVCTGTGAGLVPRRQGYFYGRETITLNTRELPAHQHRLQATPNAGEVLSPEGAVPAKVNLPQAAFYEKIDNQPVGEVQPFDGQCVEETGGSQEHYNLMPYLCLNYIISLKGYYPSRS